jgi:hypothetical protein
VVALSCGGARKTAQTQPGPPTTGSVEQARAVRVYFLLDGKVQPVLRLVHTEAVAGAALRALIQGPSAEERSRMGLESAVPADADLSGLRIEQGQAALDLPAAWSRSAVAQVVYTLTQFPTVQAVEIGGARYTRADFEQETPQILVETPLPFQRVRSPLVARGTANTFEATFEYELKDADGLIVASNFVTASSGSGERGTFELTAPFAVARSGLGTLSVFERSAEDGSRIHEVTIPVRLDR